MHACVYSLYFKTGIGYFILGIYINIIYMKRQNSRSELTQIYLLIRKMQFMLIVFDCYFQTLLKIEIYIKLLYIFTVRKGERVLMLFINKISPSPWC